MRSIRLSLMLYFLGLLTVALGVASLLVYRSAQQTLRDKEEATAKLIEVKFEKRQAAEQKRLDDNLLDEALALAGRLQLQFNWSRLSNRSLHTFGAATAAFAPNGHLAAAPWLVQMHLYARSSFTPPVAFEIWRTVLTTVQLNESDLVLPPGHRTAQYFQVDTNHWGAPLRSPSLGTAWFPDPQGFGGDKMLHWEPDNFTLPSGKVVRRVRVKTSSARRVFFRPSPMHRGGRPGGSPMFSPRPEPSRGWARRYDPPPLFITLQVAADLDRLDDVLSDVREERDAERESLQAETAAHLGRLRGRLLGIFTVTFLATVLGSCWLVWLGLLPLRRVSEAVSKVSPRDFRLPLDTAPLPLEVRPIVERMTATLDLLKRAFAREKQATADISHELRTPLAAMITTLELALRKPRPAEQYCTFIRDCLGSAQHMHQVVERLLTLARLDAGVDRLRPQTVDVVSLAQQCATVVRPLAAARGLELEVHADGPLVEPTEMTGDPDKLREVLNNLLHNAIQYNRPAGRIDLHVGRENGSVRLEVSDTGIGIPGDARERIFERFYRADPSRTGDGLNAGLGLAIVKEYVDLMGGRIMVESQEGQGSTFRVELPVHGGAA